MNGYDLMDINEVAAAFGTNVSSVRVAMTASHRYPSLARKLPAPLRKIGKSPVWLRADVEAALVATSDQCDPHGIPRPVVKS